MPLKTYYYLTKPGIIYGNALAALAGFLLASKSHIDFWLLLAVLLGVSLVIASGCVFNNYIDRGIDEKMSRTKRRALVRGVIKGRHALIYATFLGISGFVVLLVYTNLLTVMVGVVGLVDYVILYGYSKRRSVHGTLIGSISGATPPVAGYVAATDRLDVGAVLLFLILVFWQMPHFYAIAMYRLKDYTAAGLPVLPVERGSRVTKRSILAYIILFTTACVLLTVYGYTGYVFLIAMIVLGGVWIWKGLRGWRDAQDDARWARGMFFHSLLVLVAFCVLISATVVLP